MKTITIKMILVASLFLSVSGAMASNGDLFPKAAINKYLISRSLVQTPIEPQGPGGQLTPEALCKLATVAGVGLNLLKRDYTDEQIFDQLELLEHEESALVEIQALSSEIETDKTENCK